MRTAKLTTFKVNNEMFTIYGTYEINETMDYHLKKFKYPEFYDLSAKKIENEIEIDFHPDNFSWTGHKYDAEDMISDFIMNCIVGSNLYETIYIEQGLVELISSYTNDAIDVNGIKFSKNILSHDLYNIYELTLITNEYTYYLSDDQALMFRTAEKEIVSDNYFAEVGYWDSVENIINNQEKLLWGELPEEE